MRISFVLLVFATLAVSCKKSANPPPPHQNTLSASVNGTAFVPTSIRVLINSATSPGATGVSVRAGDIDGQVLFLFLSDYNGTKSTFILDNGRYNQGDFCTQGCDGIYESDSVSTGGEVKIISFDKTTYKDGVVITGTFQFDSDGDAGQQSVTNGHFSLFVPQN